jgi:uncharacterized protein (TIGR03790 family)
VALPWLAIGILAPQCPQPQSHPELLIVVNGRSAISVAIGSYYRAKRGVPPTNVLTLDYALVDPNLGSVNDETASRSRFDNEIRIPIETFLTTNGLQDSIRIIVLMPGIPLRTGDNCSLADPNYFRDCRRASVDAELAVLFSSLVGAGGVGANGEAVNPYLGAQQPFAEWRAANPSAPLRYLVARLAGYPTPLDPGTGIPVDVKNLIDRAQGSLAGTGALIDETLASPGYQPGNLLLLAPSAAALDQLGVPVQHDTGGTFVANALDLAAYASWGSNDAADPGEPFYGPIGGNLYPGTFASRAIAADIVSYNARTFIPLTGGYFGQSLLADLIALGVAGAAGTVWEPLLGGVVRMPILFRGYFDAPTEPVIEAFYRSVPYLSWMNAWIGDPLMTSFAAMPVSPDRDGDGVDDDEDNCIWVPNPDQRDTNDDGYGNLCDPDLDGDGRVRTLWSTSPTCPAPAADDLLRIQCTAAFGPYDVHQDLDGDGDVDTLDSSLAGMFLLLEPGPSALAP